MSIKLIDFKDIQDSILEELKIQDSDTVSIQRIKRAINEVYINEVVPHARWKWLENHTKVRFNAAYSSGTVEVTPSSTTVTFSTSPDAALGSFAGKYFSVVGHTEVYIIDTHTAGSDTAELTSEFLGSFNETASFKVWTDKVALPTDCRETVTVWHNMYSRPMDAMGWQKFRELTINNPKIEGYPRVYYTGDFVGDLESSRYRELRVHPAIYSSPVTISIDYIRDVVELTDDGDEPVIPVEDRIVLKYGALAWAWRALMRNPEEANTNFQLFSRKLERMTGKIEDSHDKPQLNINSLYMKRRRAPKYKIGTQVFENGSGGAGNSSSAQFLQDAIIQGARFTADVTVDTGVTVDGVDISELAQDFADHLTDAIDAHDASAISVVPAGSLASDNVQDALEELQADVETRALDSALTAHINDSSDAHDASAISFSPVGSIAATDAQTAIAEVATDAASALSTHEADTTAIHGITDTADLLLKSTLTTKGDIYVRTSSAVTRQGIGSDGQVLTADSTQANGLKWADAAGGGEGVNFISNGKAETSNIFSQYNDSSTTRPVDGTGGTASNLSSAVSSTSPLAGTQSFILTKSGSASTQGMGWSVATATIDPAYRAKVLQIEFDYIVNSGTFVAGSSTAESDVIVYIYDVTNSQLIEPSSIKLLSNSSTISDKFVANFQTSATGSSYRLIFHCQSSSTANYSLKLDNIKISPCNYVYGTPIINAISKTYTLSNAGNATVTGTVSQIGERALFSGTITIGSSLPTSSITLNIPSGYSMAATGYLNGTVSGAIGASTYTAVGYATSSTSIVFAGPSSGTWTTAVPATWSNGNTIKFDIEVPIQGWSSSTQMSDGYDGREISAHLALASNYTPAANAVLKYDTVVYDKTNSYSISTGLYTVPSAGRYRIVVFGVTTSASGNLLVYKNGVANKYVATVASASKGFAGGTTIEFNAGDTIGIHSDSNVLYSGDVRYNYVTIEKIQAPTTISATERFAARYTATTSTSLVSGSDTRINFNNKTYDTHNAVTTGSSWVFTAPVSGPYSVKTAVFPAVASTTVWELKGWKNGTQYNSFDVIGGITYNNFLLKGSDTVYLNAGDTFYVTMYQGSGGAIGVDSGGYRTYIDIELVK